MRSVHGEGFVKCLRQLCVVVLVLGGWVACDNDFTPASTVENTRLLGVRTEVEGAVDRAWPTFGERVASRFFIVAPGGAQPQVSYALVACADLQVPTGAGQCAGPIIETAASLSPSGGVVDFSLEVPGPDAFPDLPRLRFFGLICPGAAITLAPGLLDGEASTSRDFLDGQALLEACTPPENEDAIALSYTVPLQVSGTDGVPLANLHPAFDIQAFTFDGMAWDAATADAQSCAPVEGMELPEVRARAADGQEQGDRPTEFSMGFAIDPARRESLPAASRVPEALVASTRVSAEDSPELEVLQISHFAELGELSRQFSFVENDDDADNEVMWEVPAAEDVEPGGSLVRFHFVIRDGRQGLAFETRALCVRR